MPILKTSNVLTAMVAELRGPEETVILAVRRAGPGCGATITGPGEISVLILYQRDDCHLCDQALAVLAAVRAPEFASVFIDEDARLVDAYGERVPVLRRQDDGRELDWPFDASALKAWLL